MLTHERLFEALDYDEDTGEFRWKAAARQMRGKNTPGKMAGKVDKRTGRWYVGLDYKVYLRARLAWFWVHGKWPNPEVDHIDLNKSNDRIKNLREANRSQQNANTSPRGASGRKGVTWNRNRGKWQAQIKSKTGYQYLGLFDDLEMAATAYAKVAREAFGKEFVRL